MSCCPSAPVIATSSDVTSDARANTGGPIQPGESVECYEKRVGNPTGRQDDATGTVPDKIANTSILIPTTMPLAVSVQFALTSTSTRTAASWTATGLPTGISLSTSGLLSGTFDAADYGKPFEILVTASDAAGTIDSRSFRFSPTVASTTNSIQLILPLPGGIVNSKFGPRVHPISGVQKPHTGIDLKRPDRSTTDVLAACDGQVIFAGVSGSLTSGYGNCVKIRHVSGAGQTLCTTVYGHLATIYVAEGQTVAAGQKIGKEGTTGSSTGNHLHFECRLPNNTPIDPVPLIRGGLTVSESTTPTGDAEGALTPTPGGGALTPESVQAQSKPC